MESQDPEERVAELERQLAQARAAAQRPEYVDAANPFANDFAQQSYSSTSPQGSTLLAEAPRRIPFRFLLAEVLPFRWWYLFAMFLVAIPPIIVWVMKPTVVLPAAVGVLVVIYGFQARATSTRLALLKWGQVATVTGTEVLSQGTYYGGTTYSNVVLPFARGWTVTRPLWSGPKTKTRIRYQLGGYQGDLVVGGREYVDGVILADQRRPERARCVTAFPYDLDRDESGHWVGRLRVRLVIGMVCWLLIMIGWVGGAARLYVDYRSYLHSLPTTAVPVGPAHSWPATAPPSASTMTAAPGQALIVNGANETRSLACNENDVIVNGSANQVDITGHCLSLTVSGSANHVSVDAADSITADGMDNAVTYHAGSPHVENRGMANVVQPG